MHKKLLHFQYIYYFYLLTPLIILANPLDYYYLHFQKKQQTLHDTLFEKNIHRHKVSEILIEERQPNKFLVTLLMISPYPYNYKSQNYALHYEFKTSYQAYKKLIWLDKFLDNQGIARIFLQGSLIIKEKILFPGYPKKN